MVSLEIPGPHSSIIDENKLQFPIIKIKKQTIAKKTTYLLAT